MNAAVKSAERILDMLETLAVTDEPMGASELARRLGFPKSSTHMLLSTLEGRGYVVGDGVRKFRLHPLCRTPARSWVGGALGALRSLAVAPMRSLVQVTGESAFLGVGLDQSAFAYVDKLVSPHDVRCDAELGQRRALHASSVGLVLLAMGDQAEAERYLSAGALERVTIHTTTSTRVLRKALADIRSQGYAVTRDTNAIGASGVAVPLLGPGGRVLAALNISAPSSRFDPVLSHIGTLVAAAKQLSADVQATATARSHP